MAQITQHFQPPIYWQQFEDLTESVLRLVYHAPLAQKIGRPGQAQDGVDVYAQRSGVGSVGVQCKRMDDLDENNQPVPGGAITSGLILDEIEKARKFRPKLDVWVLATTAKRDAKIQKYVRRLNQVNKRRGLFDVIPWFWDDYISSLNLHTDLREWYYADVLGIRSSRDQDRLIMETIATAFHRSAFQDPLNVENFDDFLQAVKDTQSALRTGELVDRQSRHVIRKAVGGWRHLDDREWRGRMREIDEALSRVRTNLLEGVKDGRLENRGGYLEVRDPALGRELERGRDECLLRLNDLLTLAQLPLI